MESLFEVPVPNFCFILCQDRGRGTTLDLDQYISKNDLTEFDLVSIPLLSEVINPDSNVEYFTSSTAVNLSLLLQDTTITIPITVEARRASYIVRHYQ